jgi:hypothetical protein
MKHEGLLSYIQDPTTGNYPEPPESNNAQVIT